MTSSSLWIFVITQERRAGSLYACCESWFIGTGRRPVLEDATAANGHVSFQGDWAKVASEARHSCASFCAQIRSCLLRFGLKATSSFPIWTNRSDLKQTPDDKGIDDWPEEYASSIRMRTGHTRQISVRHRDRRWWKRSSVVEWLVMSWWHHAQATVSLSCPRQ